LEGLRIFVVGVAGVIGLAASLSGVVGIIRMPDLYCRVQGATKNVTMGALPMLVAVVVAKGPISPFGSRALLLAFLLMVASPLATYALSRAAYHVGVEMWDGAVIDQPKQETHPT
jgi:multicomponent Na+:H+ antiporter subunit G